MLSLYLGYSLKHRYLKTIFKLHFILKQPPTIFLYFLVLINLITRNTLATNFSKLFKNQQLLNILSSYSEAMK